MTNLLLLAILMVLLGPVVILKALEGLVIGTGKLLKFLFVAGMLAAFACASLSSGVFTLLIVCCLAFAGLCAALVWFLNWRERRWYVPTQNPGTLVDPGYWARIRSGKATREEWLASQRLVG